MQSNHAVAVIGGAVAGAAVTEALAQAGHHVIVFEQNPRPFGKIEDGLPCWHVALREKEYASISAKLDHPHVHYVPCTTIGRDIAMADLCNTWGFTAVVLACGAWRDRPLPLPEANTWVGRGLLYQNRFIHWFNHRDDPKYDGPQFNVPDHALVIGGGLASIDVAKALVLITTQEALRARGIDADLEALEHNGIPKYLAEHGLQWDQLGLRGSTLCYRRRIDDMPLTEDAPASDHEKQRKVGEIRKRILQKACEKYMFRVQPLIQPVSLLPDPSGQHVAGMRFQPMHMVNEAHVEVDPTAEPQDMPTRLVVSAIGSIPEPIPGLPMRGELFAFDDRQLGTFATLPKLFAAGNVVTGRGNIVASRRHGIDVAHAVLTYVQAQPQGLAAAAMHALLQRVKERQHAVGYTDFTQWLAR